MECHMIKGVIMAYIQYLVSFLAGLIVSGLVIYLVTSFLGKKRGITTAVFAALAGSLISTVVSFFIGVGLLSTLVGGIVWLMAIRHFYNIGWLRSVLVALGIWILMNIVSKFLPTISGPF